MSERKVKIAKRIMIFWTLFIGIGAVAGAVGMLVAPDGSAMGMQALLPYFQVLPFSDVLFQNFIFPGISLFIVNGISNLTAFYLIMRNKRIGAYLGCAFGVTLMLWIIIQFVIFPPNFMSTIYFIFGLLQFICGIVYIIFLKQDSFHFDASGYTEIGKQPKTLVVYYSRLGYTRKIAYETANETGADLYEITTSERTHGFLGFAWLGRFGMHGWGMPIHPIKVDLSGYDKVILVSAIQVFKVAPPMREFCRESQGKVRQLECILVHFRKDSTYNSAFTEVEELLQVRAAKRKSIVCKFGRKVEEYAI
ncbi:MAG: hypothetical protein PHS82_04930 [Lachnospiraceae bacterium]|nr:hypothetical protein [Lachnospiraceae bacterium]